jgi:hypothetical protein
LGLAVGLAGHAAPLAFLLGGIMEHLTSLSYVWLGISFYSDRQGFFFNGLQVRRAHDKRRKAKMHSAMD